MTARLPPTQSWNGAAPVIARIAGLPASTMEAFTSEPCRRAIEDALQLRRELERTRAEIVDGLHAAIPGSSPAARRFLLGVKRDLWNGREVRCRRSSPEWPRFVEVAGPLADRLLEIEERAAAWEDAFAVLFGHEQDRQSRALVDLVEDPGFRRALALTSPQLARGRRRLAERPPACYGRKERKLQESLLRYASRAALKLSPFSTFTRLGLGLIESGTGDGALRLTGPPWSESSIFRIKRYLLDQFCQALLRYPPFRDELCVELNDTIEEAEPGVFRFIRPGYRGIDENRKAMRLFPPCLVRLPLGATWWARIRAALGGSPVPFHALVARLQESALPGAARAEIEPRVTKLLEIGFLCSLLPWPSNEVHLEARVLSHLQTLPRDPPLDRMIAALERIVALEAAFAVAAVPEQSVEEISRLLDEVWRAAAALAGLDQAAQYVRGDRIDVFEDVFLQPSAESSRLDPVVRLAAATAQEMLRSIDPVLRLSALYQHRFEFLSSLSHIAARQWPRRREMGILELLGAIQPLWREYLQLKRAAWRERATRQSFNPLGLPQLDALAGLRERIWRETVACYSSCDGETLISGEALSSVLAEVPEGCAPLVGACLFVQPADARGRLWVVNGLFEGTGRYGSRFTTVMPAGMRDRYTAHLTACSRLEADEVELLDLMCIQGDTLNLHFPQTPRILQIPGESAAVPENRKLRLRDLNVRFSPDPKVLPCLVDAAGRRYLPVHLGGTNLRYMPVLLKFLAAFGPGDLQPAVPPPQTRTAGDVHLLERLRIDRLVLRRKRWIFPARLLLDRVEQRSAARAFAELNQWRLAHGIPDRVFMIEKVPHEHIGEFYKPQFVDLTSPLFLPIVRSVLSSSKGMISIDEMLPPAEAFPSDCRGERWAAEVQLDSLVVRSVNILSDSFATPFGALPERASIGGREAL